MSILTVLICIFSVACGATLGIFLAKYISAQRKRFLLSDHVEETVKSIFHSAQQQRELILEEARIASKEQFEAEAKRLEEERELFIHFSEKTDLELNKKQSALDQYENEIEKKAQEINQKEQVISLYQEKVAVIHQQQESISNDLLGQYESRIGQKKEELASEMFMEIVETQRLGIARSAIDTMEQLKQDVKKAADRTLHSIYFRYQPKFIWPKASFSIPVQSKVILQKHFFEESPLIKTLVDGTDSALSVMTVDESSPALIKISGGLGTDKEVIRLTLEEMISKNAFQEERVRVIIDKHRKYIDKLVLKMGEDAVKILGLKKSLHPEILKLIGSLNYRTSHRQNQYYHSLEVARLAGMIADDIGVDAEIAKRAGILHDIGKVLDYKIEGSHAVISGDYAMRFGETEQVVDTVLAHHDDKIVETPFAYILKAADALSGARPGARVDMEEGYNRRIDGISGVINSFSDQGVVGSGIMYAGREVHVYVDNNKVKQTDISDLADHIAKKLEQEVEYPGQIRVTVIRRTEVTEVA